MKRLVFCACLTAVLALPATAAAQPNGGDGSDEPKNAAHACKQLRAELGEEPFASIFGTNPNKRNAFGKCVTQQTQTGDDVQLFTQQPQTGDDVQAFSKRTCRAERNANPAGFRAAYGSKHGKQGKRAKRRALHRCVRAKTKQALVERNEAPEIV